MSTPLEVKLRSQASVFPSLLAILGTIPFRWYRDQLQQGSVYPAIVVQLISDPKSYVLTGRMPTSWARVQFTIWDTDPERIPTTESALLDFFDVFNGVGPGNLPSYPVEVVNTRETTVPNPEPKRFTRMLDAMIFSNDTL
jgi:hypothetical protein